MLLVHHNGFDKWVPPGGHIEPGDTFAQTAAREVKEETGLDVEIISAQPNINPGDKRQSQMPCLFMLILSMISSQLQLSCSFIGFAEKLVRQASLFYKKKKPMTLAGST